jgi:penicillin-binding protein 1A
MEVKTGEIKVLIGGKDFATSPYNRATQAKRQPGSAFKPIIYLTALEEGFKPDMMLRDAPVSFVDAAGNLWQPGNYNNEYFGDVTMRKALEHSLNAATVRLLEKVGVSKVIAVAKSLHINSSFAPNLSLALGSTEVSPLDLAGAYATIAREGTYIPPTTIKNVLTNQGEDLRREPSQEQVIPPDVAYTLIDMMKGVIKHGTAAKAAKMPYFLAGKTGTTNEFRDAWFAGFSPNLLCLVWVGYDKGTLLGKKESGATAALPIWMEFMSKALSLYPNEDFAAPDKEEVTRYVYPPSQTDAPANGQPGTAGTSQPVVPVPRAQ